MAAVSLGKLLHTHYIIPPFQRCYEWHPRDNALQLLQDLHGAFVRNPKLIYNLNTICLANVAADQSIGNHEQYLNDGQQRLITVLMILCALRDVFLLHDGAYEHAESLHKLMVKQADPFLKRPPRFCLELRDEEDNLFFLERIVMLDGALDKTKTERGTTSLEESFCKTEAQLRMLQAAKEFYGFILARRNFKDMEERAHFTCFIREYAHFFKITAPSLEESMKMFITINARGVPLTQSDLLKAHFMSTLALADWSDYARKWEAVERSLKAEGFSSLINLMMSLFEPSDEKVTAFDFFSSTTPPFCAHDFLTRLFDPCAKAYAFFLVDPLEEALPPNSRVLINFMRLFKKRVTHLEWLRLAVAFYSMLYFPTPIWAKKAQKRHAVGDTQKALAKFLCGLERTCVVQALAHCDEKARTSYVDMALQTLLKDGCHAFQFPDLSIEVLSNASRVLPEPFPHNAGLRIYLVLRLEAIASEQFTMSAPMMNKQSVEHILPQTVGPSSPWVTNQMWGDKEYREACLHKLGNLVPLSQTKNSKAQNSDFDKKKTAYFCVPLTPFVTTNELRNFAKFTPHEFRKRQLECESRLRELYQLQASPVAVDEADTSSPLKQPHSHKQPTLQPSFRVISASLRQFNDACTTRMGSLDDATARLDDVLEENCLRAEECLADGNCQFAAIADQFNYLGVNDARWHAEEVREQVCEYLARHEGTFSNFVIGSWHHYLARMRKNEWGDHCTLVAAANCWMREIIVLSSELEHSIVAFGEANSAQEPLILGHIFEKHYVSTRPISIRAHPEVDDTHELLLPGGITLVSFGDYLLDGNPVGFESSRKDTSFTNDSKLADKAIYHSRVVLDAKRSRVMFEVVPEDHPELGVRRNSATAAWNEVLRSAKRKPKFRCNGLKYFGLRSEEVQRAIAQLPRKSDRDCQEKPPDTETPMKVTLRRRSEEQLRDGKRSRLQAEEVSLSPAHKKDLSEPVVGSWLILFQNWAATMAQELDESKLQGSHKEILRLLAAKIGRDREREIGSLKTFGELRSWIARWSTHMLR